MRRKLLVPLVAAVAAAATIAPAAAQTTTTFEVTAAGGLAVSAPSSTVDLGTAASGGGTIASQLGSVVVNDQRGELLGSWTSSVTASDFTTGLASAEETIGKANVSYWSGAATATSGTAVRVAGQATELLAQDLSVSRTAFSATGTVGNNSTTWNPTIVVSVPSNAVVGTYTGTITHSLG